MLNTVRTVAYLAVAMVVLSMTTMLTRRPDTSMVVAGRPGRGKTTLVRSILSELDLRAHAIARTARERSKDETGAISLETILVAVGLAAAAGVVVALIAAAIADAGANL